MKKEICFVLGTRPEIIKLSPVIKLLQNEKIPFFIVHTGQHFDYTLDALFFRELKLSDPAYNLAITAETPGAQTGRMIEAIEKVFLKRKPALVVVQGDTNSSLAGALAAVKEHIPLAHVEAGLRSYDRTMPEEVNRVMIDHLSDVLFAPTESAKQNLQQEGIGENRIVVTGNTIVEALDENSKIAEEKSTILAALHVEKKDYFLLTVHRQENVDNKIRFENILAGVGNFAVQQKARVIYPMHPRARKMVSQFSMTIPSEIRTIEPLGYFDFLMLEKNAALVITDSGGVQEEACIFHVPCITVRDNTERPESVAVGANTIVGTDKKKITEEIAKQLKKSAIWQQPFGRVGSISTKIKEILLGYMQ